MAADGSGAVGGTNALKQNALKQKGHLKTKMATSKQKGRREAGLFIKSFGAAKLSTSR
ncbi:hypothetical protein JQ600_22885 [Bradyrhizobium sp. AUGA SZCCT0176]|uniref:hypothetical protein n=1 Tax=unclassified Bradyrhizobium TaxID=2631580 RepID=UPI001BA78C60|nr:MULTISPECIES: hypothetical protein [unclassified Bradyrhizobium]MBR1227765.1 hypothetical protein [Bradyrhizobium sp. AUGA SZCCT0176]MBR1232741.1 hypothetical protein [Bradyrhizobium sp. AUGA SZCCT0182]MBR1281037.1 hypothetical protein [Bradyrhizobium sp. AUGA SZCCT0177]